VASVRSTIELIITGSTRGLGAAAAEARAMAERIAAAEDRVSDARRRSAEAESRVADVEGRLAGARAQHTAALSQIGVAETNLEQARARAGGSTTRLTQAEERLESLRRGGASAETIARAEADIARVRTEADTVAQNLQRAEAQLERARANASRRAGDIAALEERLAQARGNAFARSEDLARAERDLAAARRRGTDDMNRQRDGILGIFDALGRLADAFSGADGASTSLLAKMAALNSVFSTIGGPIVQAVAGLLQMVAILGALGEIVGVVGGLIGQALAGVPALLLAIGAAAGTVALGMDGIKKAAEVMKPAFDKLKAAVSDTFEKGLTPAFRQLASILPQLTPRFQGIAQALSDMAKNAIGVLTTSHAIGQLNQILAGTAGFVKGLSGGIAQFLDGLVAAAAAATPAMQALGTAIGNIFGQIGQVFSRLAADGTIQRAVQGLAATIQGLADVAAPVVELFIRMGAALGTSLGTALSGVGAGIQHVIPFFEHLAQVAGTILVDAFNQLGPPLRELVDSILPGAGAGMDGFASLMHNTVLPAITDFINFLRTDGIPGIVAFTKGAIVQFLEFATSVTSTVSSLLGVLSAFFKTLAVVAAGTPLGKTFLDAAAAAEQAKGKVDGLTASLNTIKDKTIAFQVQVPSDRTTGEQGVLGVAAAMDRAAAAPKSTAFTVRVPSDRTTGEQGILGVVAAQERVQSKTVTTTANVPSGPTQGTLGNQVLEGAIGAVINKTVTTTSNVPGTPVVGTQGNQALTSAIGQVNSKTVATVGNVPGSPTQGTQGNQALTGAINNVISKTVSVVANVTGTDAVRGLISAISGVVSKTVNIVANVIGNPFGRASGGPVVAGQTYLVGEKGPELLTMGSTSGFITDAQRTRQIMSNPTGVQPSAALAASSGGDAPITVNVMLSQDQIAGIAQVEIARRDRATKRTVLAGSGVTF
jgi:predicted  nucleic acid-binding Zn-ribbon protein